MINKTLMKFLLRSFLYMHSNLRLILNTCSSTFTWLACASESVSAGK